MKRILITLTVLVLLSACCYAADFDGYIVKLKDDTAQNLRNTLALSEGAGLFSDMADDEVASLLADELDEVSEINADHLLLKAENLDAVDALVEMGVVDYYEEDVYLELFSNDVEGNARFDKQWYLDYINASYAWNLGVYGEGVNVGVVDSGVYKHDDLVANLLDGINYDETEGTTCNTDSVYNGDGHGTTVAGIIAAECNDIGHAGIAFKSKIVPLRVINSQGKVSTSDAADAVYDAIDIYGCQVLNLSFGSYKQLTTLYDAIMYAVNKNVIVVAAAGNNATMEEDGVVNRPQYPAYYEEVISVANACLSGNSLSIYKSSTYNDGVDVAAPATDIDTLISGNGYKSRIGTSFASPMVAAAAALVKSVDPSITPAAFMDLVKSTADASYIASSGKTSEHWGAGLLDIEAMMKKLIGTYEPFASDVVNVGGENVVYITNTNSNTGTSACKFLVSVSDYDENGTYLGTITEKITIAKGETITYSLTKLGVSSNAVVEVRYDRVPGDANGDGAVNVSDATEILIYIASNYPANVDATLFDVAGDDGVDVSDATAILLYIAYNYPADYKGFK